MPGRASVKLGSNPRSTAGECRGPGAAFLDLCGLISNPRDDNNSEIIEAEEYLWRDPLETLPQLWHIVVLSNEWPDFPGRSTSGSGLHVLAWMVFAHPVLSMGLPNVCTQSECQKMEGVGVPVSFVEAFSFFFNLFF